ncbi:sodium/hydrogen exchanger 9B2-like isoform X2 [Plodia interpunctella]|uniref:sodium/hydrogen exchanger 9B2-like isoform X2 n=1 Tax=Plodia interpunctella TaxID=58824 RepID=UPI002368448C|nr:sodium/hydrogen exchanger 9B2-like isoform X2 [Plodia interpunctella]
MNEEDNLLVKLGNKCDIMSSTECAPSASKNVDYEKNKHILCDGSTSSSILHFTTLFILGLCVWGFLWSSCGSSWNWNGEYFRLVLVGVVAWGSGLVLQRLTSLPPLLAALLTGILARYLNLLDMRQYTNIDGFLRKIYPIVILGKGSLAWDVNYIRSNWGQVVALGVLPWLTEVTVLAALTNILLGFPWIWGFMLGSVYASVSCPVVMPLVVKHSSLCIQRNWPQFVCTAGGVDTALSVGIFGVLYSFLFYDTDDTYRYAKAGLSLFAGVALGISWGTLAGLLPHAQDYYATELRILLVVMGALSGNFITSMFGWGGTAGVAVLACNATAATFWVRRGWKLNNNPAATTYHVFWAFCEPLLFAYTGTFFVIDSTTAETSLVPGFAILAICLSARLCMVCLVCWNLSLKEKLFVCCTWIPKSIVEAVLCPVVLTTLISKHTQDDQVMKYAEDIVKLIVQAILVTTPLGYLLTSHLGPILMRSAAKDIESAGNQVIIETMS